MRLEEVWARDLPHELGVPSGLVMVGDTVVAWYPQESAVVVSTPGGTMRLGLPGTRPIAAQIVDGRIEVVESDPLVLALLTLAGDELERRPIPLAVAPYSAAFVADSWFLAGRETAERHAIWQYLEEKATVRRVSGPIRVGHLSASRRGLVVSTLSGPFEVALIDPRRGTVMERHVAPLEVLEEVGDSAAHWVGLPAMDLGPHGLLQTLSDLRSDHRILLRYATELSGPVRVTSLEIPMAMLAAGSGRHLGAVRNLNKPEVVAYRWQ